MRAIRLSFLQMLKYIRHDMMLFAALTSPVLAGTAIRFIVPLIEKALISFTGLDSVMSPYYGLFDIFYASLSPAMFCFISAMVMLEEHDDHIDRYLFITGLGKNGYIISRIVIPALSAFVITAVLLPIFRLTDLTAAQIIFLSLTGTLQGIIIALLIVTISSNKLEGMAITKLSSLIILGAVVPYFVSSPFCFCFSFLPSFWMGKSISDNTLIYMVPSLFAGGIWIMLLQRRFLRSFI